MSDETQVPDTGAALSDDALESVAGGTETTPTNTTKPTDTGTTFGGGGGFGGGGATGSW